MAETRTRAEVIAQEAYARWLGVRVDKIEPDCARIELPYKEENSNPGKQVHGGVVASALAIAARIAACAGVEGQEPSAAGMLSLNVGYLASAVGEAIVAESRVMRRGKELCYVRSEAANPDGKPLGTATVVYRAAPGIDPCATGRDRSIGRCGRGHRGAGGRADGLAVHRGRRIDRRADEGRTRAASAGASRNQRRRGRRDSRGRDRRTDRHLRCAVRVVAGEAACGMRVSTVGIDVEFVNAVSDQDLIARSRMVGRKREIFFNRVEIESAGGTLAAYGSVIYRIVLPEAARE